jgi:hypothetical protein
MTLQGSLSRGALVTERKGIEISGTLDIETEDWTKFVVGGLWSDREFVAVQNDPDAFFDELRSREGTYYAHNLGGYDGKWFLDCCLTKGLSPRVRSNGARVVELKLGKLVLKDSYALFKHSLETFTKGMHVAKQSLGLTCSCGESCGGYCAIRRHMAPARRRRLTEYLQADCESLFEALRHLERWASGNDLDLRTTCGASAWVDAKRKLGLTGNALSTADWEFARQGYYGGRCQVFRTEARAGWETDVSSMYPWALTRELPVGKASRLAGAAAARAYRKGEPGLYHVRVHQEGWIPVLPVRGISRNSYPEGEVEGVYPLPELVHAESCGAEVLAVTEALVWEETEPVMRPWVSAGFKLRREAPGGKSGPVGKFMKDVLNSFSGKMGSRAEKTRWHINPSRIKVHDPDKSLPFPCPTLGRDCGRECWQHCTGKCGVMTQVFPGIHTSHAYFIDDCARVEWAAYLTAYARVKLHKQLIGRGQEDAVYCDTDSVFSVEKRQGLKDGVLGAWEDKGAFRDFKALAPKFYSYKREGKPVRRSKGVPGKVLPADFERGFQVEWKRMRGFAEGARQGQFFARDLVKRCISPGTGDRVPGWVTGKTFPPEAHGTDG